MLLVYGTVDTTYLVLEYLKNGSFLVVDVDLGCQAISKYSVEYLLYVFVLVVHHR